jgi:L,D-peptidoglycan transpeptidase YkuD (ErfK/YbiS/YcfS/YnhG family)
LSLGVSYPNTEDAERGLKQNLITPEEYDSMTTAILEKRIPLQNTKLGGEIYLHGGGTANDWTKGCVALVDDEIKEILDAITIGMKVNIFL